MGPNSCGSHCGPVVQRTGRLGTAFFRERHLFLTTLCVLQESLHELLFVLPPAAGKLRLCTPWSSKRVRQFHPDDVGWNMLSRLPSVKAVKAELCIVSQPSLESQLVAASSLGFPSSGRDGPFIERQILRCAEPGRESIKLPICRVKRSEIAEIAQGEGIKIL